MATMIASAHSEPMMAVSVAIASLAADGWFGAGVQSMRAMASVRSINGVSTLTPAAYRAHPCRTVKV
jgi:hypothetical protein